MKRVQLKQKAKTGARTNVDGKDERKGGRFGPGAGLGLGLGLGLGAASLVAAASRPAPIYVQSPAQVYAPSPVASPAPVGSGDYRILAVPADVWSSPTYAGQVRAFLTNGVIPQEYYLDDAGRRWVTLLVPTWNGYYRSTFRPWYQGHDWHAYRPWFPKPWHSPRWGRAPLPGPRPIGRKGGSARSAPIASGYEATWRERVARLKQVDG
jgi:hypothetical protein